MIALLDTSILVGLEQGRLASTDLPANDGAISVITLEELSLGVYRATSVARPVREVTRAAAIQAFEIVPVTLEIAQLCAEIRADGRLRGVRYEPFDSLIGATARHLDVPVFTQDDGFTGMAGVDVRKVSAG